MLFERKQAAVELLKRLYKIIQQENITSLGISRTIIMKNKNITGYFISIIILGFISTSCFAGTSNEKYSELLKNAVGEACLFANGCVLVHPTNCSGSDWSEAECPPGFIHIEELETKEAIPFLLEVIDKGPSWNDKRFTKEKEHIARCYAVLCFASTGDSRAFPILSNLLLNGTFIEDINSYSTYRFKEEHDIRRYAAIGLGILADSNAVDLLISILEEKNYYLKIASMFSLARIGDNRAIKPMIESADDEKFSYALDSCMSKMTKIKGFPSDVNKKDITWTYRDFPELGILKSSGYNKVWQHWLKVGKKMVQKQFEDMYSAYNADKKRNPNLKADGKRYFREIMRFGVANLPFLMEKIKQGDTGLIPIVSQLTREVKPEASLQDCLSWWEKNKQKWTIPFDEPNKPDIK